MALRLKLRDGRLPDAIEADTEEEFISLYRRILSDGLPVVAATARPTTRSSRAKRKTTRRHNTGPREPAKRLVRLLLPSPAGLSSEDVAKGLGLSEARSLGGFVTALTSWGSVHGLAKADLVTNERRRENGRPVRYLKLTDRFRQMVEEGKVKGLES